MVVAATTKPIFDNEVEIQHIRKGHKSCSKPNGKEYIALDIHTIDDAEKQHFSSFLGLETNQLLVRNYDVSTNLMIYDRPVDASSHILVKE